MYTLSPQSSVLSPQSSVLSPQSSVLSPQSSVLTPITSHFTPHILALQIIVEFPLKVPQLFLFLQMEFLIQAPFAVQVMLQLYHYWRTVLERDGN